MVTNCAIEHKKLSNSLFACMYCLYVQYGLICLVIATDLRIQSSAIFHSSPLIRDLFGLFVEQAAVAY